MYRALIVAVAIFWLFVLGVAVFDLIAPDKLSQPIADVGIIVVVTALLARAWLVDFKSGRFVP